MADDLAGQKLIFPYPTRTNYNTILSAKRNPFQEPSLKHSNSLCETHQVLIQIQSILKRPTNSLPSIRQPPSPSFSYNLIQPKRPQINPMVKDSYFQELNTSTSVQSLASEECKNLFDN